VFGRDCQGSRRHFGPDLADHRDWTFWQWSAHEKLDGYDGDGEFIDMNAFRGNRSELESLLLL
jgi:lysozyme